MAHLTGWLAAFALGLFGCGDALVDSDYRGTAIWQVNGVMGQSEGPAPVTTGLRVALFFSPGGPSDNDLDHYVELVSSSMPVQLPSAFTMNIFAAPAPAQMVQSASPSYAIGRILGYLDLNGNGQRDAGEPVAGLDVPDAVVYAPTALAAGQTLTTGTLPVGFHLLLLPQLCQKALPMPLSPGDCGVPLGAPCQADTDCGAGQCITEIGILWPEGTCVVPEPPLNGCRPQGASFYPSPTLSGNQMTQTIGYYLKPCQADADCVRPSDHMVNAYICDPGLLACVPSAQVNVTIGSDAPVIPFCGDT